MGTEIMSHSTEYAEAFASIYFTSHLVFESGCPIYTIPSQRKMENIGFELSVFQRGTTNQGTLRPSVGRRGRLQAHQS